MGKADIDRLSLLPPIRRARGFRLYAENGRRFLDCWQEEGALILGHRPSFLSPRLTDDLSKGLSAGLPSRALERLERLSPRLFPGYAAALAFSGEAEARAFLPAPEAAGLPVWKPFLPVPAGPLLLVLPPLPAAFRPALLLAADPAAFGGCCGSAPLPSRRRPSAAVAAAALRGLQALRAEEEGPALALRLSTWERFDRFAGALFERRGPWLKPLAEDYSTLFSACLERGVLLNPSGGPSLVPLEFNDGDISALKELRP